MNSICVWAIFRGGYAKAECPEPITSVDGYMKRFCIYRFYSPKVTVGDRVELYGLPSIHPNQMTINKNKKKPKLFENHTKKKSKITKLLR